MYLDCSLFSLINNASGALYLVQYWTYNGTPFPTQPLPIQISFPYFTAPNVQNVDANTGNTEVWNFAYQNTGTGDAHVSFKFDIDQCSEYTLQNTDYSLDNGISWNACTLGQFSTPSQSIAPGDFLLLRQTTKINGCAANCGPVNTPPPQSLLNLLILSGIAMS